MNKINICENFKNENFVDNYLEVYYNENMKGR